MVRMIRIFFMGIRFIIPWIMRAVWFTITMIFTAVTSLWVGTPTATRRIANKWHSEAIAAGFPTNYDKALYYALIAVAFLTIILGWIFFSYATVWLLGVIF